MIGWDVKNETYGKTTLLRYDRGKYDLKNESSVKADYYRNTNQEYSVHCQVTENALPLIDLTITVPSEAEAQAVTDNWQKKNQELYATIMAKLLG